MLVASKALPPSPSQGSSAWPLIGTWRPKQESRTGQSNRLHGAFSWTPTPANTARSDRLSCDIRFIEPACLIRW